MEQAFTNIVEQETIQEVYFLKSGIYVFTLENISPYPSFEISKILQINLNPACPIIKSLKGWNNHTLVRSWTLVFAGWLQLLRNSLKILDHLRPLKTLLTAYFNSLNAKCLLIRINTLSEDRSAPTKTNIYSVPYFTSMGCSQSALRNIFFTKTVFKVFKRKCNLGSWNAKMPCYFKYYRLPFSKEPIQEHHWLWLAPVGCDTKTSFCGSAKMISTVCIHVFKGICVIFGGVFILKFAAVDIFRGGLKYLQILAIHGWFYSLTVPSQPPQPFFVSDRPFTNDGQTIWLISNF